MKEKILNFIKTGNYLLSSGTFLSGEEKVTPEQVEGYNLKLRELKSIFHDITTIGIKNTLHKIEILDYDELIARENENPPNIINRLVFALWTGDFFLSDQTVIKSYIRKKNMSLDLLIHLIPQLKPESLKRLVEISRSESSSLNLPAKKTFSTKYFSRYLISISFFLTCGIVLFGNFLYVFFYNYSYNTRPEMGVGTLIFIDAILFTGIALFHRFLLRKKR